MMLDLLSTNPDWIPTIVRLVLGVVFFAHGAQKLLGWFGGPGLKETLRTMHEFIGLPVPLAFAAIATEFFGGFGAHRGTVEPCRGNWHWRDHAVGDRDGKRSLRAFPQLV